MKPHQLNRSFVAFYQQHSALLDTAFYNRNDHQRRPRHEPENQTNCEGIASHDGNVANRDLCITSAADRNEWN